MNLRLTEALETAVAAEIYRRGWTKRAFYEYALKGELAIVHGERPGTTAIPAEVGLTYLSGSTEAGGVMLSLDVIKDYQSYLPKRIGAKKEFFERALLRELGLLTPSERTGEHHQGGEAPQRISA
ncbi:hypothetical protein [Nocardia sp. XZ_19_231]|uniref:hypothetical protein n=1 Tax=Nocardia sp. XZ_19_231 TaxID=2769252 RepID=UPI00188DF258|nr:hypothetical protein [Nocardia sp. XZ_19_231]